MAALELCGITKQYSGREGNKLALDHISLRLEPGIYGLLGPNGAGKSTLMNIITGNLKPTAGEVRWEDKELSIEKESSVDKESSVEKEPIMEKDLFRKKTLPTEKIHSGDIRILGAYYRSLLGYAPQQQGLYDHFSGVRFLSYMATLKGISRKEQPKEIERVLRFVNLWDVRKQRTGTYSGGMKQRLLIAQAVLGDPKCIILDEPTAGLDPKERVRIREQIRAISGERVIIVSTHVVSDIESIASRILLLKAGHLVDQGTVASLCGKYGVKGLEEVYLKIFGEESGDVSSNWI